MTALKQNAASIFNINSPRGTLALVLAVVTATAIINAPAADAQTFTVLHAFNREGYPLSGVTLDAHGNLYGATAGIVYKLTRKGSGWIYSQLYTHGTYQLARPLIGSDGSLYLTDAEGGAQNAGMVFNLRPPATFCGSVGCLWEVTVLHKFDGGAGGNFPTTITFDSAGNIYGTTVEGGFGAGIVYKLTPNQGSWTFTVVTDFFGTGIANPGNGVVLDQNGNLYGTTISSPGQVFEVTSSGEAQLIYQFLCCQNGDDTYAGVILDSQGSLYGSTAFEGPGGAGGTVYELSSSNGRWTLNTLQGFPGIVPQDGVIGTANLLKDGQGNLYGASTWGGAAGQGLVFKLTPSGNGWIYTDLHDFTGGDDGCYPWDGLAVDSGGNLYGTTSSCGQYGQDGGTLWQITP
jgi:uncharacterized repeat protein (TIGR03803 family)